MKPDKTNLLVSRLSVLSSPFKFVAANVILYLRISYYLTTRVVVSKLTYPSLKKPKGYFKQIVQRDPDIQIV